MKRLFGILLFWLLTVSSLSAGDDLASLHRRAEALAIGEMTLAYRLIALTVSLSIAGAADNDALLSLLENVESTLTNGKAFLSSSGERGGGFTREVISLLDETLSCSQKARGYTTNKSYDNLQKVRSCMDALDAKIADLSDRFNKAAPSAPATPAQSQPK